MKMIRPFIVLALLALIFTPMANAGEKLASRKWQSINAATRGGTELAPEQVLYWSWETGWAYFLSDYDWVAYEFNLSKPEAYLVVFESDGATIDAAEIEGPCVIWPTVPPGMRVRVFDLPGNKGATIYKKDAKLARPVVGHSPHVAARKPAGLFLPLI
jgi:hypothetical protein